MPASGIDAEALPQCPSNTAEMQCFGTAAFELSLLVDTATLSMPAGIDQALIRRCCQASLHVQSRLALPSGAQVELSLQLLDSEAMQSLNHRYRNANKPTNVLSFPADLPVLGGEPAVAAIEDETTPGESLLILGDLVLCPAVLADEAAGQGKPLRHHWAHMLVHGCLHLCGHDHLLPGDAERMESEEIRILSQLGIPNPYAGDNDVDGR